MTKEGFFRACQVFEPEFRYRTSNIAYEKGGIFFSEMFAFLAMCVAGQLNFFIESGRGNGQSTMILAQFGRVISIDARPTPRANERLDNQNAILVVGQAEICIDEFLGMSNGTALLIDGPKGPEAFKLAMKYENSVNLIGIHDVANYPGMQGVVQERWPQTMFTNDKDFVDEYSRMDDLCWRLNDRKPYEFGELNDQKSYGPTLAVIPLREGRWT